MVAADSQVRGGNSVLKFFANLGHRQPAPTKAPEPSRRVDVHAQGGVAERPPLMERINTSGENTPDAVTNGAPQPASGSIFGYSRTFEKRFRMVQELAKGGNGVVSLVEDLETGQQYAVKVIPKVLTDPNLSDKKKEEHTNAIKREVEVMRRLRGCLNVASLEEVYEDDSNVYMVMEYCSGGELHHRIGDAHYSERTVASFMRATLRTLAQCHANKILHRDIKPGNFILYSDDAKAPLKAIDFGLAVFFNDKDLPRTDLGLEGTPWFMAPEALRSEVYPSSDIWSAGVMAHQLLTGRFPFDDKSNPFSPSLTKVWKSILSDNIDFNRSHWAGISDEAKDFVKMLLNKDPKQRPTAKEALKHPWLQGKIDERSTGNPLSLAVVQRIQRYSQSSVLKRSVLELIAEELLSDRPDIDDDLQVCSLDDLAQPVIADPQACPLAYLYEKLAMADKELIDRSALADGLTELGYKLSTEEIDRLLDQLDLANTGQVAKSQLAASQIDWGVLQQNNTERWLRCARRAFADLDSDKDGLVSTEDMVALLRHKLPPQEVEAAVKHALEEASRRGQTTIAQSDAVSADGSAHGNTSTHGGSTHGGSSHGGESLRNGLNFRSFLRMLNVGSADSLDLYDDRLGSLGSPQSFDRLNLLLEKSMRGAEGYPRPASLAVVPETPEA